MPSTRKHFVILYRAHEGSSALVERLAAHPDIRVPLFEDLDNYVVAERHPEARIEALLDGVYRTGSLEGAHDHAAGRPVRTVDHSQAIGFKWRIWGDPAAVAAVLARHGVVVFHLFRRNGLEAAVSRHFNDVVVPTIAGARDAGLIGGSNQFAFMMLPPETQQALKARMRATTFPVPVAAVIDFLDAVIDSKRGEAETYGPALAAAGVGGEAIFYEDFARGDDRLPAAIAARLGCGPSVFRPGAIQEPLAFKRVSSRSILGQVTNLDEIEADPAVRARLAALEAIIAGYPPLIGTPVAAREAARR